jgi:hypothetical protein
MFKNKLYIYPLLAIIFLIIMFLILKHQTPDLLKSKNIIPADDRQILSPREDAINKYLAEGIATQTQTYGDVEYSLILYPESDRIRDELGKTVYNSPNDPPFLRTDAGAILYKDADQIWESKEPLDALDMSNSGFVDVDNDGVYEIVLIDNSGEKVFGCAVNIYSFDGNEVKFIVPYDNLAQQGVEYKSTKIRNCTDISDIDGDRIMEITTEEFSTRTSATDGEEEIKIIRIYKYNGTEYFLWKEEIVPVEE